MRQLYYGPENGGLAGSGRVSEESVRTELELILKSAAFRKSERQSRFLRFICEKALAGEGSKLNEYLIAHDVFEKGADYSPGEDSIVRRQAYSLRQRLQDYYLHEGLTRPIRIELPVGRYVPTFSRATEVTMQEADATSVAVALASGSSVVHVPTAPKFQMGQLRWFTLAVAILCLAAGFAMGWLTKGRAVERVAEIDSGFRDIWGAWLSDPRQALVAYSTPMTASIQRMMQPYAAHSIADRLAVSPGQNEAEQLRHQLSLPPGGYLYLFPGLGHAKMGEALGCIKLCVLLTKAGIAVRATESRFLNWDDFRRENVILLGHDEANSWIDPMLQHLPLQMVKTSVEKPRRILNLHPQNGERTEYFPVRRDGTSQPQEDYALISMIAGADGQHQLAIVSGVNSEGTQMGLEYLTDPKCLRSLGARLSSIAPRSDARHFQLILHSEVRDRMPIKPEVVAIRLVP